MNLWVSEVDPLIKCVDTMCCYKHYVGVFVVKSTGQVYSVPLTVTWAVGLLPINVHCLERNRGWGGMMRRVTVEGQREIEKNRTNGSILMHHNWVVLLLWLCHHLSNYDLETQIFWKLQYIWPSVELHESAENEYECLTTSKVFHPT